MINNELMYFNQQISNNTGNYENLCLKIIKNNKNKLYLYDCINDNIKISIIKIINPDSKKGKNILFYLGYNIELGYKMIIECKYSYKSKFCYNKKLFFLLIITSNCEISPKVMHKYKIYKKNYIYNNTLIQNIN
jgi:hypothetical protein